jgi:hypothetical protein
MGYYVIKDDDWGQRWYHQRLLAEQQRNVVASIGRVIRMPDS